MIVSKFDSHAHAREVGIQIVQLLELPCMDDGRYATSWGPKTADGLARSIERIYRASVYGVDETVPEDDRYYAANISGEDPQWPKPVDKTDLR